LAAAHIGWCSHDPLNSEARPAGNASEAGVVESELYVERRSDLVVATVRWPYLNEQGEEVGEEAASYTPWRGEDDRYELRSLLLRTLPKRK
jgi:hypothetical protein